MTHSCNIYVDGCSAYAFAQPLEGNGVLLSSIWTDGSVFGAKQGTGAALSYGWQNQHQAERLY